MRYHFSDKDDEANTSSSYMIWSTGSLPAPNILKTIHNPYGAESSFTEEQLSSLYSLDVVSPSQKRKILDCEKGDFEERFRKIQRKRQLQRVVAKAHLVIDDEEDSDEEGEIYEQMDWIEKENEAGNIHNWESSDEEGEDDDEEEEVFEEKHFAGSVLYAPRSKWKEERRRLLRISMAKIRRVEDPESYLRRSVLINNTVKRLQKDVTLNSICQSVASTSLIQGSTLYQSESHSNWVSENLNSNLSYKQIHPYSSFGVDYTSTALNSDAVIQSHQSLHSDLSSSNIHLQLAFTSTFSSDKLFDVPQQEILHNATFGKNSSEEQRLRDVSVSSLILKQPSPLPLFSSQPCGLQYRSIVQDEDNSDEYNESPNTSSILDSVVYHSLVASLET